jgi:hypothetical protein
MFCPRNLANNIIDASHRFEGETSDFHKYYQAVCTCGGELFELFESNLQTVHAVCTACSTRLAIYDLEYYPAATKLSGPETFETMNPQCTGPSRVFVQFEYGEPEPDVEFDANDVTWCAIYTETPNGDLTKVFNDETA